jgi:Type I restriction and modification enzyme - subunit R C terminal.
MGTRVPYAKGFITQVVPAMESSDDFEYRYDEYLNEKRRLEIREIAAKYEIDENQMNDYIGEYEFGGIIDTNAIKSNISKEIIQKEKEANHYPTSMRTKNIIAQSIATFIEQLTLKYL